MKRGYWIAKMIVFGLLMVGLLGLITMSLWNWLVPDLFHGPVINFGQTLGLLLLSKIFLWSFGKKGHYGHQGPWRQYWKDKWSSMTPEDKERIKQKMKEK